MVPSGLNSHVELMDGALNSNVEVRDVALNNHVEVRDVALNRHVFCHFGVIFGKVYMTHSALALLVHFVFSSS